MIFQVAAGAFRVPSSQDKEAQMYRKKRMANLVVKTCKAPRDCSLKMSDKQPPFFQGEYSPGERVLFPAFKKRIIPARDPKQCKNEMQWNNIHSIRQSHITCHHITTTTTRTICRFGKLCGPKVSLPRTWLFLTCFWPLYVSSMSEHSLCEHSMCEHSM